jgi:hypothetical protein
VIDAIASVNRDLAGGAAPARAKATPHWLPRRASASATNRRTCTSCRRAVYAMTRANLLERYTDYSATCDGVKGADAKIVSSDDLYRDARFAIRDILSTTHNTVELI